MPKAKYSIRNNIYTRRDSSTKNHSTYKSFKRIKYIRTSPDCEILKEKQNPVKKSIFLPNTLKRKASSDEQLSFQREKYNRLQDQFTDESYSGISSDTSSIRSRKGKNCRTNLSDSYDENHSDENSLISPQRIRYNLQTILRQTKESTSVIINEASYPSGVPNFKEIPETKERLVISNRRSMHTISTTISKHPTQSNKDPRKVTNFRTSPISRDAAISRNVPVSSYANPNKVDNISAIDRDYPYTGEAYVPKDSRVLRKPITHEDNYAKRKPPAHRHDLATRVAVEPRISYMAAQRQTRIHSQHSMTDQLNHCHRDEHYDSALRNSQSSKQYETSRNSFVLPSNDPRRVTAPSVNTPSLIPPKNYSSRNNQTSSATNASTHISSLSSKASSSSAISSSVVAPPLFEPLSMSVDESSDLALSNSLKSLLTDTRINEFIQNGKELCTNVIEYHLSKRSHVPYATNQQQKSLSVLTVSYKYVKLSFCIVLLAICIF